MSDGEVEKSAGHELSLSLDAVFELLADRRRRYALYELADVRRGVIDFADLVEAVATLEAAVDGEAITRDRYLEVASELYHWHLEVLADVGVVDYDERSRAVRYWTQPALETWLHRARLDELAPDGG
ncbi:MAG: hypothetical protein ABEJ70_00410 [Halobacteriaceae archaeon]